MNRQQDSKGQANFARTDLTAAEQEIVNQSEIVKEFFQTDHCHEIIESLNMMVENLMFTESMDNVTLEMREHVVNQLRVATLISRLDHTYNRIAKLSV